MKVLLLKDMESISPFRIRAEGANEPFDWYAETKEVALVTVQAMSDRYQSLTLSIYEPGSDDLLFRMRARKVVFDLWGAT